MGDRFYNVLHLLARSAFWSNGRPVVIGVEHTRRAGAYLLAANHASPYDVPLIMLKAARHVDFVSIVEMFRNPIVGFFYGSLGAFPLDRTRPDTRTLRTVLDRLARGRVVGIFPEGRIRRGQDSVVFTRRMRPGVGRIARLAQVPIVPCVVVASDAYERFASWLPHRRTRWGVIYGPPIEPDDEPAITESRLCEALVELNRTLRAAMAAPA